MTVNNPRQSLSAADRVVTSVRDQVAYVTLNRPDKYNGVDFAMLRGLVAAAKRIEKDRDIRAVLLQGSGSAFCAGLDFSVFREESSLSQLRAAGKWPGKRTNLFQQAIWVWRTLPVPVIAVVDGYCYGAGFQLALAADFRYTTPDCEFSIMEGKYGLIPDMTGSVTLRELVPMDIAKRLTMTAEVFDGRAAKEYGLVTEVSDEPLADAEAFTAQLLTRSPDGLAAAKRLFHDTWTRPPRRAFWTETVLQLRLITGANHKIARKAAASKDQPRWRRRSLR
ncbi:crotonase/enoyl-CoA hydratase family protein [Mycolicibacillus koreensis]|uniref:crotonase/enoyl-CoA hydratase family protein n=1 Tax=Mycolicibacillus koreensis TaxID=1069220 RepID=UPI00138BD948|nr:enoyl-CoA hydratase/isomerase family protein [Mycolicibacillus koreensis]